MNIAEIEALWFSCIEIWGVRFTSIFSKFFVMAGWIAKMLFMLFFAYNGQNIAEYKAYWLMGFLIIVTGFEKTQLSHTPYQTYDFTRDAGIMLE